MFIATDNFSWSENYPLWKNTVTDIEKIGAVEAIEKYAKSIDIVSWPVLGDVAYRSLKRLYQFSENTLTSRNITGTAL
ncbi:hypothetical protein SFC65_20445 [Priestia filamentosa]|uniref:hypothetical protein n=1 Tax=Priestia filamentosa TaxID=1402861 RepID=UPI0039824E3E